VLDPKDRKRDHVAVFVVTGRRGNPRTRAERRHKGTKVYYFKSHGLQALAIEERGGLRGMAAPQEFARIGASQTRRR